MFNTVLFPSTTYRKICYIFILTLILFCLGGKHVYAATYYVSPKGNDSNSGTVSSPFRTPQKAANIVNPGDTVIFENGTYTASTNYIMSLNRGGNSSNWITFKARNNHQAIFDGVNYNTNHSCINLGNSAAYVKIEGLALKRTISGGVWANSSANNIIIDNNLIQYIGQKVVNHTYGIAGVFTGQLARNFIVEKNTIHDIGRLPGGTYSDGQNHDYRHDHGWYAQGKGHTAKDNVFYNCNAGWGIKIDGHYSLTALGAGEITHQIKGNRFNLSPNAGTGGGWLRFWNNRSTSSTYGTMKPPRVVLDGNYFYGAPSGLRHPVFITDTTASNFTTGTVMQNNVCSAAYLYSPTSAIAKNIKSINNTVNASDSMFKTDATLLAPPSIKSVTIN